MACTCYFTVIFDYKFKLMFFYFKVNEHLKDIMEQEQKLKDHHTVEASGGQKARYRKEQTLLKQLPCIPLVENLLKDGSDGCALAALIHFYCPGVVRLEDICLKETMSLADSLYNLQLIQEFCQEYLNQCCHFTLEDMLYAASSIKSNYLVFMAELFWWFEVVKPSFVQPRDARPQGAEPVDDLPSVPVLNAAQRNALDSSDFTPRRSRPQAHPSASGGIRRSSSMSYVDSFIGTWPKEKRSSVHGVSFDISFDKESSIQRSTPNQGITRSISNEGLTLNNSRVSKNIRKNLSFKPVNGEEGAGSIEEELHVGSHGDLTAYVPLNTDELDSKQNVHHRLPNGALQNRVLLEEFGSQVGTPSIEEALQIIHDTEKPAHTPRPDQLANGFFLHSQEVGVLHSSVPRGQSSPESVADTKGASSPVTDNTEVDTGIHVPSEDIPETMDEDSSLRDYTVSLDSDVDDASKFLPDYNPREAPSPCPSTVSTRSQPGSSASSSSGVKMTSFAEQKFRKLNHTDGKSSGSSSQKTTPEGSELNIPHVVAWAQTPEDTGLPHGRDTTQLLASEVVHLRMKLEEKRRAIEAQKKKMEAAFTKQRQKMGRTAFLTVDDQKAENDMAMKRAALLEKRLRREKETQLRKQQLEAEMEHKKEETRRKTEEERQKKEDERARREFIRQEYLRRKQLKLMEDMDTVIKPRPQGAKQKKQRPKSIHRDHIESPKTPIKGPPGPKLFKEPSAKSNKHIIQNALAHCCLAGKVNEGQKKKILEEMEKSDANNFLILFRDSGCQFRSLYTYCPETEEINKLTGIGPKSITKKMIEGLYKYNSDRKQFSHIPAKTLSASVDAITIHSHLWQTKRPVTPKKLLPTKA
eukprot:bmy_20762T0